MISRPRRRLGPPTTLQLVLATVICLGVVLNLSWFVGVFDISPNTSDLRLPIWPSVKHANWNGQHVGVTPSIHLEVCPGERDVQNLVDVFRQILKGRLENACSSTTQEPTMRSLRIECFRWSQPENEEYVIDLNGDEGRLIANSRLGVLRGLSTFIQLPRPSEATADVKCQNFHIPSPLYVKDSPAHGHRGLLLDTARNYYMVNTIKRLIRTLAMSKYNVLHWHLSDDESFGMESKLEPRLTRDTSHFYTQQEIHDIVEEGVFWGVNIIPELDMPGHAGGWIGEPDVMSLCPAQACRKAWGLTLNPHSNRTWEVLGHLFEDVSRLFPSKIVHLGGDEVDLTCWEEHEENLNSDKDTFTTLGLFETRLTQLINRHSPKMVIRWQEVTFIYTEDVKPPDHLVLQIWSSFDVYDAANWNTLGVSFIASLGLYLDANCFSWQECLEVDPYAPFVKEHVHLTRIIGLETCAWELTEEMFDSENIWLRIIALGERMWRGQEMPRITNTTESRLQSYCEILSHNEWLFPSSMCKNMSTTSQPLRQMDGQLKAVAEKHNKICRQANQISGTNFTCGTPQCEEFFGN